MHTAITAILTVHNSERYLEECLESVCRQSIKTIEILCVDGGSSDRSPDILEKYRKMDSRIKIINDCNTSYGHKVNTGIFQAEGEYIAIVETDDMLISDMFEKLYGIAVRKKSDYVDADFYTFFSEEDQNYFIPTKKYLNYSVYNRFFDNRDIYSLKVGCTAIWTGIYRRDFLIRNNIRLNESAGASYQDASFRFLVSALAQNVYHLGEPLYCYRTDNAESSVRDMDKVMTIAGEYQYLKKTLEEKQIKDVDIWNAYYKWKYAGYYWNLRRLDTEIRSDFERFYIKEIQKDLEKGKIDRQSLSERELLYAIKLFDDRRSFYHFMDKEKKQEIERIYKMKEIIRETRDKGIIIFGCGQRGHQILGLLSGRHILCLCDNDTGKQGKVLGGYGICSCEEAVKRYPNAVYVVANKRNSQEIKKQLLKEGISEEQIILY